MKLLPSHNRPPPRLAATVAVTSPMGRDGGEEGRGRGPLVILHEYQLSLR